MRTSATSGITFLIRITIVALTLTILLTVAEKGKGMKESERPKRVNHCLRFGPACMGGHGKRFDPRSRIQKKRNYLSNQKSEELDELLRNDELFFVLPSNDKSREELNQPIMRTRQNTQQYDPYNRLTYYVNPWMASNRRAHRRDLAVND